MKKIFQGSDGVVRLVEGTRELDEVFAYFCRNRGALRQIGTTIEGGAGGMHRYVMKDTRGVWCRVYPEHHPEAPALTSSGGPTC